METGRVGASGRGGCTVAVRANGEVVGARQTRKAVRAKGRLFCLLTLPATGLTRGPSLSVREGWWGGGTEPPCGAWRGHSAQMAAPTPGPEQTRGAGQRAGRRARV